MSDLFFLVRMFVVLIAIIVVMQIQVNDQTVEQKVENWIQTSATIHHFRGLTQDTVDRASNMLTRALRYIVSDEPSTSAQKTIQRAAHLKLKSSD